MPLLASRTSSPYTRQRLTGQLSTCSSAPEQYCFPHR
nr:unnamed protein product [Callosobruchus analis]